MTRPAEPDKNDPKDSDIHGDKGIHDAHYAGTSDKPPGRAHFRQPNKTSVKGQQVEHLPDADEDAASQKDRK